MSNNNDDPLSQTAQSLKLGVYGHFKGHNVTVIGVARHSEDPTQEFVVYDHDGKLWIRPLGMFLENVDRDGYSGPRFKHLG
ncbi:MAG TPA: DUF1653 domain-containing protein [Patescibacteria group bacterium]|nr:DUF1653 domain-containing protein [Patescibacteria group bacterium]